MDGKEGSQHQGNVNGPPIRIDTTLQLAWGLTMNLSHETTENSVGATFLSQFEGMQGKAGDDAAAKAYLTSLYGIVAAYLRTSGYERDAYIGFLNVSDELRDAKVKNVTDVADVASVSSGSLLSKIGAFLGVGSLAQLVTMTSNSFTATPGLPFNLTVVIAGGLAGVAALVFLVRLTSGHWITNAENENFQRKQQIWAAMARPAFRRELRFLRDRVKANVNAFYPGYTEEVLEMDEMALDGYIDGILPSPTLYSFKAASRGRLSPVFTIQSVS